MQCDNAVDPFRVGMEAGCSGCSYIDQAAYLRDKSCFLRGSFMSQTDHGRVIVTNTGSLVDVDFSLAIHNRTGKFFIGEDILNQQRHLIGNIYYGRLALSRPPSYLVGRLAGRLQNWELTRLIGNRPKLRLPLRRPSRSVLHLDPLTAPLYALRADDIVLVHDLGPITHPAYFEPKVSEFYRVAYACIRECAPRLVFVSEASRAAYRAIYGDVPDMRVVYPPIRSGINKAVQAVQGVPEQFLLTVGAVGARKGQRDAVAAFVRSGLAARGVAYVICGGQEAPGYDEVIAAARAADGVVMLPYVDDSELAWLYRKAVGFILTSHLEGFGMPVAEAIASGLVTAVSGDSVLEEVAGAGTLTVVPGDMESIAKAMCALVDMSPTERDRRRLELQTHVARFSTEQFCNDWRKVLSQPRDS